MAEASAAEKLTHPAGSDLKEPERRDAVSSLPERDPQVEDDDEEETCAFCKFMKAGGCKAPFVNWMECVDREKEKGNDFVETCMTQIQDLRECMMANPDYYRPMLEEEDAALEEESEAAAARAQKTAAGTE